MQTFKDADGNEIIYVHIPPHGEPKPCLASQLAYALQNGYRTCDAPGKVAAPGETIAPETATVERETITPECAYPAASEEPIAPEPIATGPKRNRAARR